MATAFLDRYYDEVDDCLADPHSQKRLTKPQRYAELYKTQQHLFERFLNMTGQESSIGYCESIITVVAGQSFYPLPPLFRQFLAFEMWNGGDRDDVIMKLPSVHGMMVAAGVEILAANQGMIIHPAPPDSWAGDWTLIYRKGPAKVCHGVVYSISADAITVVGTAPATADDGTVSKLSDYYAGSILNIYDGESDVPQSAVIQSSSYNSANSRTTFTLRTALSPKPVGVNPTLKWEISPDLPEGYDSIYAIQCAIRNASYRNRITAKATLKDDHQEAMKTAANYYLQNVADRSPTRLIPPRGDEIDPYE